jgi:intracellular multiplication protein IcmC
MSASETMLENVMEAFSGLETLLNLGVMTLGVILTGMSIFKFIALSHDTTFGQMHWVTPVMYLISGVALFNFASSIDTFLQTFYGPSTSVHALLSYTAPTGMSQKTTSMLKTLIAASQLYGYFTFARAWVGLRRLGSGQHGSDEVFKASLIRLCAGVGLINIVETIDVVSETLGFGKIL